MRGHCPVPCGTWSACDTQLQGTQLRGQAGGWAGHLPLWSHPPQLHRPKEPPQVGSLGVASPWPPGTGSTQGGLGSARWGVEAMQAGSGRLFSASSDPWGSCLGTTLLWMLEAQPGRVRVPAPEPVPGKQGPASGDGAGRGRGRKGVGRGSPAVSRRQHQRCVAVCALHGGGSGPLPCHQEAAQEGSEPQAGSTAVSDEKRGECAAQPEAGPGMGGQRQPEGLAHLGEWTVGEGREGQA